MMALDQKQTDSLEDNKLKTLFAMLKEVWPLLLGNVLEWYDFGLFGFLAVQMKEIFFRGSDYGTWAGFAVTFMMRPLGSILNGMLADYAGRRVAVVISLVGMMIGTVCQGLLPNFHCCSQTSGEIGLVLLLVCRALQGMSAGGELGPIVAYFSELAPKGLLCTFLGIFLMTCVAGFVSAALVVLLLVETLGPSAMLDWGWRLPFLIAILPGSIAVWGRSWLPESEECLEVIQQRAEQRITTGPLQMALRSHKRAILLAFAGSSGPAAAWYSGIWCSLYLTSRGLQQNESLLVECLMMLSASLTFFTLTLCNDLFWRVDPLHMFTAGNAIMMFTAVPVFLCLSHSTDSLLIAAVVMLGIVWGCSFGAAGSHIYVVTVDLFPTEVRALGFGLSVNMAFAYVGGSAALVNTALIDALPSIGPGLYWTVTAMCSTVALTVGCYWRRQGILPCHLTSKHDWKLAAPEAPLSKSNEKDNGQAEMADESTEASESTAEIVQSHPCGCAAV